MAEKVFTATGRRKTSVARVFLRSGKGNITINDKSLQEYFGRETARMIVLQPFEVTQTSGNFDIDVNVVGCGSPSTAQESGLCHSRPACCRTQEIRPS